MNLKDRIYSLSDEWKDESNFEDILRAAERLVKDNGLTEDEAVRVVSRIYYSVSDEYGN